MSEDELWRELLAERFGPLRVIRRESTHRPQTIPRAIGTDDPQAVGESVKAKRRKVLMGEPDEENE